MKSMNVVEISCYHCTYSSNSLYYENYVFLCWQMGQWCEVEEGQWKCKPNTLMIIIIITANFKVSVFTI